jgi:hypothetical protein
MAPPPVPSYAGSGPTPTSNTAATTKDATTKDASKDATKDAANTNTNNANGGGGGNLNKIPRRTSGKSSHSRSYPRGVGLDFRKLAGLTLVSYIDHHGALSLLFDWSIFISLRVG